ncbi:hypothetical protein TNCV_4724231 [Trichonephila clavipes]|uniref:Uncharacterized protein n=1 Tax=Trichonephila clavipes TaxID=2585209 RepID=A0A8X7BFB6_TRICX|nr:hypothetical protein TNCV_4724231 [Trichonephila clavipes]
MASLEETGGDICDGTAPNTEDNIGTPQAPVEGPDNVNMADDHENSDEPQLAINASELTSSSTELLEISEMVGKKVMGKIVG